MDKYVLVYFNGDVGSLCGITGFYGMSTIWSLTMKYIPLVSRMFFLLAGRHDFKSRALKIENLALHGLVGGRSAVASAQVNELCWAEGD